MRSLFSRRRSKAQATDVLFERCEPRIVLDGTPADPNNPVVELSTNFGNIYIELFESDAPVTVENFLGYVERGDYDSTFFHRHVADFVIQGGGWSYDADRETRLENVVQQEPIVNEYGISNTEWTVAMAKVGGDPDSATSEWFINLADNSGNLDEQNGGFTVFGEVVGGFDVVQAITDLRIVNLGSGFENVPVTETFDVDSTDVNNEDLVFLNAATVVYDPETSLLVETIDTPNGAATGANVTTVVIENQAGRSLAFNQVGLSGDWTVSDLNLKTDTSGTATSPVTWIDTKDGLTYAAAISDEGLLLYKNTSGTTWEVRNLNDEIQGADLVASSLTAFTSQGNKVHIAGLTSEGDVMLFIQTGAISDGDYTWTARNLSDTDLADQSLTTPAFTSELSSYVTSWNGLNIVGLDAAGDIQSVWWSPGLDAWTTSNLSDITGAAPIVGSVAPYLTSWDAINLTGVDGSGNVVVTWWVPGFGGTWETSNLTTVTSGPALNSGTVSTYVTSWGATNVVGINADGDVVAYWWTPDTNVWTVSNLSAAIDGAESPTGPVTGFSSPSGVVNLYGATDDGELLRYYWRPGGQWTFQNVSDLATLR